MPDPSTAQRPALKKRLYAFLALARVSNSPTVISNVLAGAAMAGAGLGRPEVILIALAMFCLYSGGMYLNDLCDYEVDRRIAPERPLPSGLISWRAALVVTGGLFATGGLLLGLMGARAIWSGLLLVVLIVAYDLWHRAHPPSVLLMGLTRVMVYVTTFLAFAAEPTPLLYAAGLLMLLYIAALTLVARSEKTSHYGRYWPLVLLLAPASLVLFGRTPVGALLALLFAAWVVYSAAQIYRGRIGRGITRLIAGISLFDALILYAAGSAAGVLLAFAAFGLTLLLQRYIKGT